MTLSSKLVREYQNQYRRKFGKDITAKEAEREIFNLKDLVKLMTKVRRQSHGK